MAVVVDSAPLIAAANSGDDFHLLAWTTLAALGREVVVPDPVAVEVDWMLRDRGGPQIARRFLAALESGEYQRMSLTPSLFTAACELDETFGDLALGLVDSSVMAIARATDSAILTFDFTHFRAAAPKRGRPWSLLIDEAEYERWRGRS